MPEYANIRSLLPVSGMRVLDVTQHDELDYLCGDTEAFVAFHFENGTTVKVFIRDDGTLLVECPR